MDLLILFYRRTNPVFFSIEKIFGNIAQRIVQKYPDEFQVREIKMPFPSKPRYILKNMGFVRRHQATVNHVTGDVHYTLLACSRKKVNIITIHDCVPLHQYRKTDPRYWVIKWLWYNWPVRKSDMVTVVSENTKQELIRVTNADARKIRVINNFVDPIFQPIPGVFDSVCPRILFIGTTPNKNLERLIKALEGIPVILDIVGELSSAQLAALNGSGIEYQQSSKLSPAAILKKYVDCHLLAFPSTYEGFGLPIVEAQAVGRPVLTSDRSPMKEVAGPAACLVDPYNIDSIREGLLRIIRDGGYREKLVGNGHRNAARFSLDQVTDEYASLYRELIRKKQSSH
jgi:glycosyltransferase involved in cell wall biosynthesis